MNMTQNSPYIYMISLLSSVAFIMATYMPTIVDPLLTSRSVEFSHQYPLGHCISLIAIPVFVMTYLCEVELSNPFKKSIATGLNIILPSLVLLPNFDPIPHGWVLQGALTYAFVIACISFVHNWEVRSDFIDDKTIDIRARIERIKIEHEKWYRILFMFVVGISGLSAVTVFRATENYKIAYPAASLQELEVLTISIVVNSAFFFILMLALAKEILDKMLNISDSLIRIKSPITNDQNKHIE